jgi:hypothetical protein
MKSNILKVVVGLLIFIFVAAFLFVRGYSSIKKGNLAKINQQQNLYSDNTLADTSGGTDNSGDDSGNDSGDNGDSGDDSGN